MLCALGSSQSRLEITTNTPQVYDPHFSCDIRKLQKNRVITERMLTELMTSTDEDIKVVAKGQLTEVLPTGNRDARNRWSSKRTRSLSSLGELKAPYRERYPVNRQVDRGRKSPNPWLNVDMNDLYLRESYPPELLSDDEKQSQSSLGQSSVVRKSLDISSGTISTTQSQGDSESQEVLEYWKHQYEKTQCESEKLGEKLKNMPSVAETLSRISFSKPGVSRRSSETLCGSIFSPRESSLEGLEGISVRIIENDFSCWREEELEMITRDIDKFEHRINETRTKIKDLQLESLNVLTTEMTGKTCYPVKGTDTLSYLEIDKKIGRLEDESDELKSKRRAAVSSLQSKMVENIFFNKEKELSPLLPIHKPKGSSASMLYESQNTPSSFHVPIHNSSQFSRVRASSESESSDVEKSST